MQTGRIPGPVMFSPVVGLTLVCGMSVACMQPHTPGFMPGLKVCHSYKSRVLYEQLWERDTRVHWNPWEAGLSSLLWSKT